MLTALDEGSSRIFAEYEELRSPYAYLSVTSAELERVSISPTELSLIEGEQVQLSAIAHYSDGASGEITNEARWIIGDGTIAQLDEGGLLTATAPGETALTLNYENEDLAELPVTVEIYDENGRADLIITELTALINDGTLQLDVRIKNQGNKGASDLWVDLFLNEAAEEYGTGDIYERIDYLGPNHTRSLSYELPYELSFGSVSAMIDTNQEVEESHENNNLAETEIIDASESTGPPDLLVRSFTYLLSENEVTYTILLENAGGELVNYAFVDLFTNRAHSPSVFEDGDHFTTLEDIGPGEQRTIVFEDLPACLSCLSWVYLDSYNFVAEANESNNLSGPLFIE
jgi:hypothetical protein